ncbi:MAG: hypothetical protein HYW07_09625 [Candidatus Latescibacteria bacterium]|nr:hypothetical protein [Candidatus Latescibacterota bacterium]
MKTAKFYPFEHHPTPDSCWSLSTGPDGRIYASSCCEGTPGGGVFIVRYNDEQDRLDTIVDVAEAVGEPLQSGRATQCKIHYSFAASPATGIMYAATHLSAPGYGQLAYSPWADWKDEDHSFPHSTLLAWDTRKDEVAWTSVFIPREGCRCLALDEERGRLYAISYMRDHFWIFDLNTRKIRSLGRLGSINSQGIFTDRQGRVFTSNGDGQLVRYSPHSDKLEEIPVFVPYAVGLTNWHAVIYDVVASPEGDCVYGVPWNANPHLFRYWPEDGPYGRMEDLGPVHQDRDQTIAIAFYLDHCGGLVFGADGMLYYATCRWPEGEEGRFTLETKTQGIVVQYNPKTGEKKDFAKLVGHPGGQGHYVARGGRDRHGNLFFGQVPRPIPAGISRLKMDAKGEDLHLPVRTWG